MAATEEFCECPKCNSENITACRFEIECGSVWRTILCEDCDYEWSEVFKFDFSEDPLTGKKL